MPVPDASITTPHSTSKRTGIMLIFIHLYIARTAHIIAAVKISSSIYFTIRN